MLGWPPDPLCPGRGIQGTRGILRPSLASHSGSGHLGGCPKFSLEARTKLGSTAGCLFHQHPKRYNTRSESRSLCNADWEKLQIALTSSYKDLLFFLVSGQIGSGASIPRLYRWPGVAEVVNAGDVCVQEGDRESWSLGHRRGPPVTWRREASEEEACVGGNQQSSGDAKFTICQPEVCAVPGVVVVVGEEKEKGGRRGEAVGVSLPSPPVGFSGQVGLSDEPRFCFKLPCSFQINFPERGYGGAADPSFYQLCSSKNTQKFISHQRVKSSAGTAA
eukprot:superscaffoldBa00002154_g13366